MGKKIYMLGQLLQEELSKFSIRALKPRRSGKKIVYGGGRERETQKQLPRSPHT